MNFKEGTLEKYIYEHCFEHGKGKKLQFEDSNYGIKKTLVENTVKLVPHLWKNIKFSIFFSLSHPPFTR